MAVEIESLSSVILAYGRKSQKLMQQRRLKRGGNSSQPSTSTMKVVTLVMAAQLVQLPVVLSEDFGRTYSHTQNGSASDETYIIISFSAFLAFCILSVIATLGYFSILEDNLMKRYLEEGEVVEAAVVSAEFARGGGTTSGRLGAAKHDKMSTEYVLFVEYVKPICEGSYMTKVRKQVKAREEDIIRPPCFTYSVEGCEESAPLDSPLEIQKMLQMFHDDENQAKNSPGLGKIEMLVMPNFYKSGISRRQAERSNGYRHRLSTVALLLSGFFLAAFCVRLAAKAISNTEATEEDDTNRVTLYMSGLFALLLSVEVLLLHLCLRKTFIDALEEEYLKSGDLVPTDEDDSSLSTGSDSFLGKSKEERLRIIGLPLEGEPGYAGFPPSPRPIPKVIDRPLPPYPATVSL